MDKVNESILSETILEDMKENRIDHMTYLEGMEVLDSDVEKTVVEAMNAYDYDSYTAADVRRAIYKDNRTPEDFAALLSPAALPFLEEIAQMAQKETRKHFGNSIMMFTPLYIANYCENYCIYCGFNCHNKIRRAKLDAEGIEREMVEIAKSGLQEILILTGESEKMSDVKYIGESYQSFNVMTKELRATEVLQMDFVSNVSHEFKTPINAIEGYTMLLQGEELSQEQEEYVEKILFNTQRLSGLVGNILLLSKLENQNIPMKKTEYRLDEQIRQAFLSLETKWTEKEIGFQVELEEVKYTGNEGLFMHIWMNLLDNAIKFSPAKGTIMMFLKQEKDSVMFILEDEGPGIEDDVKTRIFDKFYQADGSHKAEGNGLGLALVKRIVDSAGGTIKAENREYGGCRFVVELPIQKDEAI